MRRDPGRRGRALSGGEQGGSSSHSLPAEQLGGNAGEDSRGKEGAWGARVREKASEDRQIKNVQVLGLGKVFIFVLFRGEGASVRSFVCV